MFPASYTPKFSGLLDPELVEAICRHRCILCVGAGLSARATYRSSPLAGTTNLPTWGRLLEEMLVTAYSSPRATTDWVDQVERLIAEKKLLLAAQELSETLATSGLLPSFLRSMFDINNVRLSQSHLLLPRINFRAVMTLNYDTLLEEAYRLQGKPARIIRRRDFGRPTVRRNRLPLRPDDELFIFKMHGDYTDPASIVAGTRDFQDVMYSVRGYRQFLEAIFSVYTIFFVGFGGTDPHLLSLLDELASTYRDRAVHFILSPEDPLAPHVNISPVEKQRWEADRYVRFMTYPYNDSTMDHSQVDALFDDLANLSC